MHHRLRNRWLGLVAFGLAACEDSRAPTQPDLTPADAAVAAPGAGSWTPRAPTLYDQFFYGYDLATAPNASGASIVYAFGGASGDDGATGSRVTAYAVAADAWSVRNSRVDVHSSNGVGKIGNKLYFSGGMLSAGNLPDFTNRLWAYDYAQDRMIPKADMPIFSAEGVTGVINNQLYVLPGACNGNGYPNPGYCAEEPTRRFYRYDPTTNRWSTRRQAPHHHRGGAAAVIDGKFYVAGGLHGFQPVADLDVYDPATNTWRTLAPLPTAGPARGAVLGGQFYVLVVHYDGTTPDFRLYAYSPVTDKWTAKAPPELIGSATKVFLNGTARIFTATGNQSALFTP